MVPAAGIDPVADAGVGRGHHDAHPVARAPDRALAVHVTPGPRIVGQVLHPVVAELEVPVPAAGLRELHHQRGAGLQAPVAELEVAVVGGAPDALVPLTGELELVLPGQQVAGPAPVVAEQAQHELAGHGQAGGHVVGLRGGRARVLVEAADLQAGRRLGAAVLVDHPAHEFPGQRCHREPHRAVGGGHLGQHGAVGRESHVWVETGEVVLGIEADTEGAYVGGDGRAPGRQVGVGAAEPAGDPVPVAGIDWLDYVVLVGRLHALPAPQRRRDEPDRGRTPGVRRSTARAEAIMIIRVT